MAVSEQRSAALVVRVWFEDEPDGFRARVLSVGRAGADDRTVAVASSPGEVVDAVSSWLEELSVDDR
jgi:hypothetical protein